jgi:hypothetical protein
MGKRATKQKATSEKKKASRTHRKNRRQGKRWLYGRRTTAEENAEARLRNALHELYMNENPVYNDEQRGKRKARNIPRLKTLQKVALRKIGKQLPGSAAATVMEMMLGKRA